MKLFAAAAAALVPWAAFGVVVCGGVSVCGQKGIVQRLMKGLLALCMLSGGVLFCGPNVLRRYTLVFRCMPYLFLIGIFFLSAVGVILVIAVGFCRQGGARWWERGCVLLSGAVLFVLCLFSAFVFTAFTVRSEEIGLWEGKKVVMIAVEGIGYRCHEYRGPVVMGKYLGTVYSTQEEQFGSEDENTGGSGNRGTGTAGGLLPVAEQRPDGHRV